MKTSLHLHGPPLSPRLQRTGRLPVLPKLIASRANTSREKTKEDAAIGKDLSSEDCPAKLNAS